MSDLRKNQEKTRTLIFRCLSNWWVSQITPLPDYPVQRQLLAARSVGLGSALTTLLCSVEPQVKQLLDIPEDIATAAMLALGWPARIFPRS